MTTKLKKNYLNKHDLLAAVIASKEKGEMNDTLARMLMLLCERYSKKGRFINYTYLDDMKAYAMYMLVRTWKAFDHTRFDNPFAFYTQCVHNSFFQFINQERKQRKIMDETLVMAGLNPSSAYDGSSRSYANIDDEEDYHSSVEAMKSINKIIDEATAEITNFDHIDPEIEKIADDLEGEAPTPQPKTDDPIVTY